MKKYCRILKSRGLRIDNFLEIGSRDGHDAHLFATKAGIDEVYVAEPSPRSRTDIEQTFPTFKVFECALSNYTGKSEFINVVEDNAMLRGTSSLFSRGCFYQNMATDVIEVDVIRGDAFFEASGLDTVSACKIDVEGHALEVLEGFGEKLTNIHSMHVECEVVPIWDNQRLYKDVKELLLDHGYQLARYREYNQPNTQCDSIWIHHSAPVENKVIAFIGRVSAKVNNWLKKAA